MGNMARALGKAYYHGARQGGISELDHDSHHPLASSLEAQRTPSSPKIPIAAAETPRKSKARNIKNVLDTNQAGIAPRSHERESKAYLTPVRYALSSREGRQEQSLKICSF